MYVLCLICIFSSIAPNLTLTALADAAVSLCSFSSFLPLSASSIKTPYSHTNTHLFSPTHLFYIIQIVHLPFYHSSTPDLSSPLLSSPVLFYLFMAILTLHFTVVPLSVFLFDPHCPVLLLPLISLSKWQSVHC